MEGLIVQLEFNQTVAVKLYGKLFWGRIFCGTTKEIKASDEIDFTVRMRE